jgi:hypothetical protein
MNRLCLDDDASMHNTFDNESPERAEHAEEESIVSLAELQDRFRNFPVPELQVRLLIKSVPGLAA